jgi:Na+/melibiose symporter-like transporter
MKYVEKSVCYRIGLLVFIPFDIALFFLPMRGSDYYQVWQLYFVSFGAGIGIGTHARDHRARAS